MVIVSLTGPSRVLVQTLTYAFITNVHCPAIDIEVVVTIPIRITSSLRGLPDLLENLFNDFLPARTVRDINCE